MRRYKPEGLEFATDAWQILDAIDTHALKLGPKQKPDQTHDKYWTYDFSCNEDFILHAKHHPWQQVFNFFKKHPHAFGTAATKYVNKTLLDFEPDRKIRIRFSLMPQEYSTVLEPNTSLIIDRIKAINDFYKAGYDVHVNYSPVIAVPGAKKLYAELFQQVDKHVEDDIKPNVKAEIIFLTHSEKMHEYNSEVAKEAENLLWQPELQEPKTSSYGGKNLRYKWQAKQRMLINFKAMLGYILPWQEIRYAF